MKKIFLTALLAMMTSPVFAAVGVSVNIGEPGFYGTIDLGDSPRPDVVRSTPIIIDRAHVVNEPMYVRVPVAQQRNWKRYCRNYGACGRPVYFVQDRWYNNVYAPQYRKNHGHGNDHDDHHDGHDDHHDDHGGHDDHGHH